MAVKQIYPELEPAVHRLPNGLTVALEHLPHLHSASIGVWIKTGSANELEEHAGISHFLEHLFFKGTATRTARELMDAIESKGGHMNAFTSREYTTLYVRCLDRHLPTAIEILADVIQHSIYTDFEKERNVILEEIAAAVDVPEDYTHDLLTLRAWPNHALGRPIAGSLESVGHISLDDVRAYKDHWYRPENMIIAIAGNFDANATLHQLQDLFSAIESAPVTLRDWTAEFAPGTNVVRRKIAQNHLAFAFPAPAITDPRHFTHEMLSSTLGGGSTSRLFDRIREEEGLAYSIYAFHSGYLKTGMLGVYAAVAPENLRTTLRLASEELRDLQEIPVSPEELSSNAEQIKGGILLALEGTFNRMARMAQSLLYFGRIQTVEEILDAVDAVTAQDLQSLAQNLFTQNHCAMAILGPPPKATPALDIP